MKGRREPNLGLGDLIQLTQAGMGRAASYRGASKIPRQHRVLWGRGCSGSARISVAPE